MSIIGALDKTKHFSEFNDLLPTNSGFLLPAARKALARANIGAADANAVSFLDVPAALAPFIPAAPPINHANGFEWSIFAFNGGETQRAKDTATADFQTPLQTGLSSGERINIPKWLYPIRSGPVTTAATPINVECASGAQFIVGDHFWNSNDNVFQLVGDASTAVDAASLSTFSWKGGTISAQQLTSDHGVGSGFASGQLNVVGFFSPILEDVFFDGGLTTPLFNTIGAGAMDTGLGWNQNIGGMVKGCRWRGFYDVAVYGNGFRVTQTLGANPITTGSSGSAVVTVSTLPTPHGMSNGDRCFLQGVATVDGVTLADGEYAVSGVASTTFQVTATSGTAGTGGVAGGGSAVVFTNSSSNKRATSISGEGTLFIGNWAVRCTNGFAIKRNMREVTFAYNTFRDIANGIGTSGVGEYAGGDGHRIKTIGNNFFNIMNWPMYFRGGGPEIIIDGNTIENFGRQYYDGGATAIDLSANFPLAAIQVDSAAGAQLINNTVRMTNQFKGATWVAGEEPVALRLGKNSQYIDGCTDCLLSGNKIYDVPQAINDSNTGLRTKIILSNGTITGTTKNSIYGSSGVDIISDKDLTGPVMSLDSTGQVTQTVNHGLDYTPDVTKMDVRVVAVTNNVYALAYPPRAVSADATAVTVTTRVATIAAGGSQSLTCNVHIR